MKEINVDEALQKIYIAKGNFFRDFHIKPNTVNVDRDTYYAILQDLSRYPGIDIEHIKTGPAIFGMRVKVVEDGRITVGRMVEVDA